MLNIDFPKTHIILGITELNKENFNEIKNRPCFNKPFGGLWASPYYPNNEYVSAWHEWCSYEQEDWITNDSVIIKIKESSKIYTINNQNDLIKLIDIVGIIEDDLTNKLLYTIPNFEKASKIFDIIYLTQKGQCETHFPMRHNKLNYSLYGWDCESILVMNFDCIEEWEYKRLNIVKGYKRTYNNKF